MITVKGLQAGYGKLEVLHDINLQFEPDQFTAILGPNGSGKSTLIKSIFGLTSIWDGSITFAAHELVSMPTEKISSLGLAYVPQRENVFSELTIQDNLLLGMRLMSKEDRRSALEELYELFPILQKRSRQKTGELSGGERQMVAIAIGWLTRPKIMILDEPTAGLAPIVASEVFDVLRRICANGLTLIIVEQNARRVLKYCDYAFVLRQGQLVFQGSAAQCLNDPETIMNYLGVR